MDVETPEASRHETGHLKRKSMGSPGSLDSDRQDHDGAPRKRIKAEDTQGDNADQEASLQENERAAKGNGDIFTDTASQRQEAAIQREDVDAFSLEHERGTQSPGSRKRDSYSQQKSPHRERRPSDYGKWDRRESEAGRKRSAVSNQAVLSDQGRNPQRRSDVVSREEEKKRGKRLFGGLLSTLSQQTSSSHQKRRQEIEKRQQEKATKQKIEDDQRRTERLAKLDKVRKIEQVRFDEQVMRTRHSNMLAMAHSLQTRTQPRLYYRPWELTPDQEDIIKDQLRDTETQVEAELQQFKRRKEQRLRDLEGSPSPVDTAMSEPIEKVITDKVVKDEFAAFATNDQKVSPSPVQNSTSHEDKDHDEMVEADEDTVIY